MPQSPHPRPESEVGGACTRDATGSSDAHAKTLSPTETAPRDLAVILLLHTARSSRVRGSNCELAESTDVVLLRSNYRSKTEETCSQPLCRLTHAHVAFLDTRPVHFEYQGSIRLDTP